MSLSIKHHYAAVVPLNRKFDFACLVMLTFLAWPLILIAYLVKAVQPFEDWWRKKVSGLPRYREPI